MLLVAGESGAGKSSLLRAGLIPQLAAGALGPGSQGWPRRVIQPAGSPLRELAMRLADMAGADPVSVYRSLSAAPGEAPMLVEHAVRTAASRVADTGSDGPADAAAAAPRLVLIIDQFEELFTAGRDTEEDRAERDAFIVALHAAATVPAGPQKIPPALVVAVVRADFLGRLIAYPPLKAALDAGPFTVGPMSEAELRLAITGPAAEAGLAIEPALADTVIAELREGTGDGLGSGALPLMSQAMAATWERREGNELTLRGYRRTGGVADAVNRGAQAAYDALTSRQKDTARLVFTQLTVVTPDGGLARRRCRRADLHAPGAPLAADIDAVLDTFSARRLLILGKDYAEISHDVLLHSWKQLRDWLGYDQLDRALYSQVVSDAQTWDFNGRDSSYLYRPGRLATVDAAATRWQNAPTRYLPLPATGKAFLGAAHHAARRATRRRRGVIAGLLALVVITASAAGIAVRAAVNASTQHAIALSRLLAAEAQTLASTDPLTAWRLAVAAWHIFPTTQAGTAMMTFLTEQQQDGILPGSPSSEGVYGVAFSPDGRLLASAYGNGTVQLWNTATGQEAGAPITAGTSTERGALAFSPDGRLLATTSADGTVQLWNPATSQEVGGPITAELGMGGGVLALAFSPDGRLLATTAADGTVQVWNPATGQEVGTPITPYDDGGGGKLALAFRPDGRLLSADADGAVRLWNTATGQEVGTPIMADTGAGSGVNGVNGALFSPGGTMLASADSDGTVRLWNTATGQQVGPPVTADVVGTGVGVHGVAFSPSGTLLATADADGLVQLWNPATGRPSGAAVQADTSTKGGVLAMAFSPDGMLLASADADGTVRLWNTATRQEVGAPIRADTGTGAGVNGVAFSPDGTLLASADGNGNVQLWNTATGQEVGTPIMAGTTSTGGGVNGVAFSPDGTLLASADADGAVQTWQVSLFADPYAALCADVGPPTTAEWTQWAPGEPQPSVCG